MGKQQHSKPPHNFTPQTLSSHFFSTQICICQQTITLFVDWYRRTRSTAFFPEPEDCISPSLPPLLWKRRENKNAEQWTRNTTLTTIRRSPRSSQSPNFYSYQGFQHLKITILSLLFLLSLWKYVGTEAWVHFWVARWKHLFSNQ